MHYLLSGFKLIFQPKIRRFIYAPILINLVLFIALWATGIHFFHEAILWFETKTPHWLHWLAWLLWICYVVMLLTISAYSFTWIANLIGAPFYSLLSEQVQLKLSNQPLPERPWHELFKDLSAGIVRQFLILGYYLPRAIILLLFSLIPGVHIVTSILWFFFNSWMQDLQYLDYPMDNNRKSFKEVKGFARQNCGSSLGFGASVLILTMIPVVNLFVMPAAVAGATVFYLDKQK